MARMTAFAGENCGRRIELLKLKVCEAVTHLPGWLDKDEYQDYNTFDNMRARFGPFRFET